MNTCTTCDIEWLGGQPLNADGDCPVCALDKVLGNSPFADLDETEE